MVMLLMMEISLSFSFPIALCDADDAASFKYMYKAAEAYILQEFSMTCILLCCTSLTAAEAPCNSSSSGSSVQHSTFRILAMTTENNDMGGVTMFTEMAALTQFAYNFLTTVNVHRPRQNS